MSKIRSFDLVSWEIEDVNHNNKGLSLNIDRLDEIEVACAKLDKIIREGDCICQEVKANVKDKTLSIFLTMEDAEFENGRNNAFFRTAEFANDISFYADENKNLKIAFKFNNIWE